MTAVPHLALPFVWGPAGHARENEQDAPEDVAACVAALLLCPIGWRAERIEYGTEEQTFRVGDLDLPAISAAISRWEPRAVYLLEDQTAGGGADVLSRLLSIHLEVPT